MASRFWVGGGSANTWAATAPTNWGSASGVTDGVSVPGTGDMAVFDSNSGSGNSVIGANITVQGLECDGSTLGTGAYAGTLTHNTSVTLTINTGAANSLRFSAGMTYTPAAQTSIVTLTHTSGTANIKTYGKALGALTINGAGGTTQTLDNLQINSVTNGILTLTAGILDFNGGSGGPFTLTCIRINTNNTNTRSLILGGTVTLGGNAASNQTLLDLTGSGLTFTKNSANIVILPPASAITQYWTVVLASMIFNNFTINPSTTSGSVLVFSGNATFANFTIGSGWDVSFGIGNTYTITNPFTWTGTQANPIFVAGGGGSATLSCSSGACTLNWGALQGMIGSGGATFTATNTMNIVGGNTGWSISPPNDATLTPPGGAIAAMARGTVTTGATTTSVPTSALTFAGVAATGVVSNQFVGRSITFDGATTTAGLQGVSSVITATSASNTPTFTVATLPATPASGDLFTVT